MVRCPYLDYEQAFEQTRAAVADANATALGQIRVRIALIPPRARTASLVAFDDVLYGRPRRALVHFCRMRLGPISTTRALDT